MKLHPIQDPDTRASDRKRPRHIAILGYGFRPFFLLAGIHAAAAVPLWIAMLYARTPPWSALPPLSWHAHEMLYGFVAAAVAGFLLTAVPSWTGRRGYAGAPLAGLVLLWLAGRAAMTFPLGLPPGWMAALDLAFLPALALTLLPALIRAGNRRNLVFIVLLALLFASNLQFHLDGAAATAPLRLGLDVMLFILAMLGARMVPAFTSAELKQQGYEVRIARHQALDRTALAAVGGLVIADLAVPGGVAAGLLAAAGAVLLGLQLCRWQGHRCRAIPLLWVLHVAYAWLPLSLALRAASLLGLPIAASAWLHALTAGAMATMIIGVMSRASLGHTGRALIAPRWMTPAYLAITLAALTRVFGPLLQPAGMAWWHGVSSALWCLAFLLFVIVYAPILWSPRIDGKPG